MATRVSDALSSYTNSLGHLKRKPLAALAVAGLLDQMSVMMIVPFLPVFAERFTSTFALIGVVFAAESTAATLFTIPAGYISDKLNRKVLICTGLVLSSVGVVAIPFAGSIWVLIGLRVIDGIGSAMRIPTIKAYLGDIVPKDDRGSAMGAYRSVERLGVVLGPGLGGILVAVGTIQLPFMLLGLSTLAASVLLVVTLPVAVEGGQDDDDSLLELSRSELRTVLTRPVMAMLLVAVFTGVASGAFGPMLPLLLETRIGFDTTNIGFVWAVYGVATIVAVPAGGAIADSYGRKPLVAGALAGWIAVPMVLVAVTGVTESFAVVAGIVFVAGVAAALVSAGSGPLTYETPPDGWEGTAAGIFSAGSSLGTAGGPLMIGLLADSFSLSIAFGGIAVAFALSLGALLVGVPEPA